MYKDAIMYQHDEVEKPFAIEVSKYSAKSGVYWDITIMHEDMQPHGFYALYDMQFPDIGEVYYFIASKLVAFEEYNDIDLVFTKKSAEELNEWLRYNFG